MAAKANILFTIHYRLVDDNLTDSIVFSTAGAAVSTLPAQLVLEGLLPRNTAADARYFIAFTLDGNNALPMAPSTGFENADTLWNWIPANWSTYGKWFRTADKIILYLNNGIALQGSIQVSAASRHVFTALIPEKQPEEFYNVSLSKNGIPAAPLFPDGTAQTAEDILVWVQGNWSAYGLWSVENGLLILVSQEQADILLQVFIAVTGGAFDGGFSAGFDI